MSAGESSDDIAAIEEEARAWLILMGRDDAAALAREFAAWQGRSSAHRAAYARVERAYAGAAILRRSSRYGASIGPVPVPRARARWLLAGGTAMAAVLLGLAWLGGPARVADPVRVAAAPAQRIATLPGEIRRVALPGGNTVVLDGGAAIELSGRPASPSLRLTRGRARFLVAARAADFAVDAGGGRVVASTGAGGAAFDMTFNEDGVVHVHMNAGRAELRPAVQYASLAPRALVPGEMAIYRATDFTALPPSRDPAASWQEEWPLGWAEHDRISLGALVAEANRYAAVPIRVEGEGLAGSEVSGRFRIGDTDAFLDGIAGLLGLELQSRAGEVVLRRRE